MMRALRAVVLCGSILAIGTAARPAEQHMGTFGLTVGSGPYIAGSHVHVGVRGLFGPYTVTLVGPGTITGSTYVVPDVASATDATLIAASNGAVGIAALRLAPPPPPTQPLLAVATYDGGIALHDPQTFALIGYVPFDGAPGDVAFTHGGTIVAPDTDGDNLYSITRAPWRIAPTAGVAQGNEVAVDDTTGSIFVADRDVAGHGALTRIASDGSVSRTDTGVTSEGLALDPQRERVYVGNVNDDSVTVVNAQNMTVERRFHALARTFGIALDPSAQHLFVVANTTASMTTGAGYVAAFDLATPDARVVARSARLVFPLGVAFDAKTRSVFVTDEGANVVYVLDARTLAPRRAALQTCLTPWRPHLDARVRRLYIPCARGNRVDVFDADTLARIPGAPFSTGGFPLSVATWN